MLSGAVAQLVARLVRNEKVRGSNPLSSTCYPDATEAIVVPVAEMKARVHQLSLVFRLRGGASWLQWVLTRSPCRKTSAEHDVVQ